MFLSIMLEYPCQEGSNSNGNRICFSNPKPGPSLTVGRSGTEQFIAAVNAHPIAHDSYEETPGMFKD